MLEKVKNSRLFIDDNRLWKKAGKACATHFKTENLFKKIQSFENKGEENGSCHIHALSQFSNQLEKISKLSFAELSARCEAYGIEYIIYEYLDNISDPMKNDIYVCWANIKPRLIGNYLGNGVVETKVEGYVFQHAVFFLPTDLGDTVTYYRPKETCSQALPLKKFADESNEEKREQIQALLGDKLTEKFPEIEYLRHIKFVGVCQQYALGKIFGTFVSPKKTYDVYLNPSFLDQDFYPVDTPECGDLAVYCGRSGNFLHFGVYGPDHRIESKWGCDSVYRHPPGMVPKEYAPDGLNICYYRRRC